MRPNTNAVLNAALETLLWSETFLGPNGEPYLQFEDGTLCEHLDDIYDIGDIESASVEALRQDIDDFLNDEENQEHLTLAGYRTAFHIGMDYILTRNKHGTGFWDRKPYGTNETAGQALTQDVHANGPIETYITNNDTIATN